MHGILDSMLIDDNYIYPIEFKMTHKKPTYGHIMQLVAYTMLAEEYFDKKCNTAFILIGDKGKTIPVIIDQSKKDALLSLLEKIRESFEDILPYSAASVSQCSQCEFLSHCNDRE